MLFIFYNDILTYKIFMSHEKIISLDNLSLQDLDSNAEFIPLFSQEDEEAMNKEEIPTELSILPLRNMVLFPGVVIPITAGRDKSIKLINEALEGNKTIGVVAQLNEEVEIPGGNDVYRFGTVAKILKTLKLPDGNITVILQGKKRFAIDEIIQEEPYLKAKVVEAEDAKPNTDDLEFKTIIETIKETAQEIVRENPNIPSEAAFALKNIESDSFLVNFVSSNLNLDVEDKQALLEKNDLKERALETLRRMNTELQKLNLKNDIQTKVRIDLDQQQKEYFLHQQIKTIQEELGGVSHEQEFEEMRTKAKSKKWDT